MYSGTVSPTSTLERQQIATYVPAESPSVSQTILTANIGGDDQITNYRVVTTESRATVSPSSLPSEDRNNQEMPFLEPDNPYSAVARQQTPSQVIITSEKPYNRKDQIEYVDPRGRKADWSYSLCGCCDDTDGLKWCALSVFCPCYVAGRVAEAAGDNGIACCCVECLFPINCFFGSLVRRKIRLQRNILGDTAEDCFATCCCRPCALVQQAREQNLAIVQAETVDRE